MAGRPRRRKKLARSRRSRYSRDWREAPPGRRHAAAARKSWRVTAKSGWRPKRSRKKAKRARRHPDSWMKTTRRDWKGHPGLHARAAHRGFKKHAKRGWRPKSRSKYSRYFRRAR